REQARKRREARALGAAPVGQLAQKLRPAHRDRLPVHEEPVAEVKKLGLRVQAHLAAAAPSWAEDYMRLGRAEIPAEEFEHVAARPADPGEHFFTEREHWRRDARRSGHRHK